MILLIKGLIAALAYLLTLVFFAHFDRTITKFKRDKVKDCKLHTWTTKTVQIDEITDSYTVCTVCKKLAGTDYYEETHEYH